MKTYIEEDKIGKHKVIEQPNGIKIRILQEPSEWYASKAKKNAEAAAAKQAIEDEKNERAKLIADKMRKMAEEALIKEGVIEAEK